MPANNRVHSSRALQTHAIWVGTYVVQKQSLCADYVFTLFQSNTIGHDPHAPDAGAADADGTNVFAANQELLELAKNSKSLNVGKRG